MILLRVSEVASRLSLHQSTVRSLIKAGRLPAVCLSSPGGRARVRVRAEDLDCLISDPRQISCDLCAGLMPWNALSCQRCGWINQRNGAS
jgi:excisionase family DNA binding protein